MNVPLHTDFARLVAVKEVLVDDRSDLCWQIEEAVARVWVRSQRHRHLVVVARFWRNFDCSKTSRTENVSVLCRDLDSLLDGDLEGSTHLESVVVRVKERPMCKENDLSDNKKW